MTWFLAIRVIPDEAQIQESLVVYKHEHILF
jgi:hypothetical protein